LTPPADLGGPERQVFLSVVLAMPASHFHPGDIHLVVAYAGAVVRERVASGELAAAGYVTGDGKPSAWCSVLKDAIRDITTTSRLLRLAPLCRNGPALDAAPVSVFERMRLEAEANGRN
jgi:hypothetical protein